MSGTKALAVGAGAGFLGGAVAGVASVSVYHKYLQYQQMQHCIIHQTCYSGGKNVSFSMLVQAEMNSAQSDRYPDEQCSVRYPSRLSVLSQTPIQMNNRAQSDTK